MLSLLPLMQQWQAMATPGGEEGEGEGRRVAVTRVVFFREREGEEVKGLNMGLGGEGCFPPAEERGGRREVSGGTEKVNHPDEGRGGEEEGRKGRGGEGEGEPGDRTGGGKRKGCRLARWD